MIQTPLTRLLNIQHPVVQAGLGGVGRAELAASISNAGGLGMLGMIRMSQISSAIRFARPARSRRDRSASILFHLSRTVAHEAGGFESQLQVCLDEEIPVVSLFWCDAAPYVQRCHAAGMLVILQVGSVEEAAAAAAAGVDVVVAQGSEAGGHVRGQVGLIALLPAVVQAVPRTTVLAAGGIASGRGLAAALSLGAAGVWIGTRFVATDESEAHPDYRRRILLARATDAVCCDISQAEWPAGAPYRVLRSRVTETGTPPIAPVATIRRGDQAVAVPPTSSAAPTVWTEGQTELMPNYAGQGVEIIHEVESAATVVERIVTEAEDTIRSMTTFLSSSIPSNI